MNLKYFPHVSLNVSFPPRGSTGLGLWRTLGLGLALGAAGATFIVKKLRDRVGGESQGTTARGNGHSAPRAGSAVGDPSVAASPRSSGIASA